MTSEVQTVCESEYDVARPESYRTGLVNMRPSRKVNGALSHLNCFSDTINKQNIISCKEEPTRCTTYS